MCIVHLLITLISHSTMYASFKTILHMIYRILSIKINKLKNKKEHKRKEIKSNHTQYSTV
jgi:hypothetical protein